MRESNRRRFVLGVTSLASVASTAADAQEESPFDEEQRGDPDSAYETVRVDPTFVYQLSGGAGKATFNPRNPSFDVALLATARRFVGNDRVATPEQITAFLDLFDLPFRLPDRTYVPYCACGLSYAAALAYYEFWLSNPTAGDPPPGITQLRESLPEVDRYHFYPSPAVRSMYYDALAKGRWRDATSIERRPAPRPGWVIIFNFGRGVADHCGIVESIDGSVIRTIEFNTSNGLSGNQRNGGMVAERERAYDTLVKGFIATDR